MYLKFIADREGTLRNFLVRQGFSRKEFSRLKYQDGHIYVNKKERNFNYHLQTGDDIVINLSKENGSEKIQPEPYDLDIIYEDDFYLIVNKPAGIASLPARGKYTPTMANFVKYHLQEQNHDNDAVHVVTRLDRDTSGLMMFSKSSIAHSMISEELHGPNFQKKYLAVVENSFSEEELSGVIDKPIAVSDDFYMKRVINESGKESVTKYQVTKNFSDSAVVDIDLITGRTHQIRVHFASIGHGLLGDDLYGNPDSKKLINRQALHCYQLSWKHPFTDEKIISEAPIPKDISELINWLGEHDEQ